MLTELQIAERRGFIGGSDASKIVEGRWPELWAEKTGRAEPVELYDTIVNDPKTNRFMLKHLTRDRLELSRLMGHATEALNCFWYERQTGRQVTRRGELQRHPTIHYLACNLDGETTTSGGFPASFNAKHVGQAGERLILRHTAQCTHEALCLGYDWWVLSVFIGSNKWEPEEQEVDPFFAAEYLEKCAEFWGYVERDEEPPGPVPVALPPPRKLRIVRLEDEFSERWPNWGNDMVERLGAWANTLQYHQAHEIAKREIKELLPDDVGTVIRGRLKVVRDKADAVRINLSKENGS